MWALGSARVRFVISHFTENCKISRPLFADDLVLLSSAESSLRRALNSFSAAFNTARMKISTAETEVLYLLRNLTVVCKLIDSLANFQSLVIQYVQENNYFIPFLNTSKVQRSIK